MDQKSFKDTFTEKRKSVFFTLGAIILLLCLTLVSALALRNTNFANLSSAGNKNTLDYLNKQIVDRIEKYQVADLTNRSKINREIREYAQTRKNLLLKELKTNPQAFLTYANLSDKITVLPKKTQELFERKVNTKVNIRVLFSDDFKTGENTSLYQAVTTENNNPTIYNLTILKEPVGKFRPATAISGVALDNDLVVTEVIVPEVIPTKAVVSVRGLQQIVSAPRDPSTGNQRTLVILFKFNSEPNLMPVLPEKAVVNGKVFTDTTSVNSFLKENSYNNLSIYGEVTEPLTISSSQDNCNINYESWGAAADVVARTAGFTPDPSIYRRIIYLFPYQSGCPFEGISITDTNPAVVNNKIFLNGTIEGNLIAHEIVHNLEIPGDIWKLTNHAYVLNCGTKAIDVLTNCSEVGGQNQYDSMNSIVNGLNPEHVTSALKYNLGWMNASKIKDIAVSGIYLLDPLESNINSLQALRIARSDNIRGSTEYYFIDFRMPLLSDNQAFFQNVDSQGVVINLWTGDSKSDSKLRLWSPYLIDATPGDKNFANAALHVGGAFIDSTNLKKVITITRLPDIYGKAQLQVTFSEGMLTPTVTLTPAPASDMIPIPT